MPRRICSPARCRLWTALRGSLRSRKMGADLRSAAMLTLDCFARMTSAVKYGSGLPNCNAEELHFCQLFLRHESERIWKIIRQFQYVDQVLIIADEHI